MATRKTFPPMRFQSSSLPTMVVGLLALLSLLWICPSARCESPKLPPPPPALSPLPAGPLIAKVPQFVDWTVTYTYPDDETKGGKSKATPQSTPSTPVLGGSRLHQERAMKTGSTFTISWTDEAGAKEECWLINGVQWVTPKGTQERIQCVNEDNPAIISNLPLSVFPGFEWIDAAHYIGIQPFMGKKCLAFRNNDQPANHLVAYIDTQTRLPASLQSKESVRLYTFGPTPTAMLQIPADIAKVIAADNAVAAKMMAPGAR